MILTTLPQVCAEVARPLANAGSIKMISSGDGEIGASKLVGEVITIIEQIPKMIETITGVDIKSTVSFGVFCRFLTWHNICVG